jgi:hypothetical protein
MDLEVRFKNGNVYTYHRITEEDYQSFILAPSQGSALRKYLGSYAFTKEESIEI